MESGELSVIVYMRLFTLILIAFLACTGDLYSAGENCMVIGKVLDQETGKPISDVNVREGESGKRVKTDAGGSFSMLLKKDVKAKFRFTHVSYDTSFSVIQLLKDTILLEIKLQRAQKVFDPVEINAVVKPDTVVGTYRFFVSDFEFFGDQIVLLTFEKKPEKSKVMLLNEEQKIISTFPIPVNGVELFKDFLGNVNVVGADSVYRVKVEKEEVRLVSVPPEDFENLIKPCIDTLSGKIVFSDYREDYPEFNYYTWDPVDSTARRFSNVIDADLALMYSFEYDYLTTRQKVYARKMELATGIDKREIAAYMTNFAQSRYFTPLYAPLYVIRDTMYLFEHYRDQLYRFDKTGKLLDSVPINYHHPRKWREWRRKIIKEEKGDRVFGLFLKDGYYYLKEVDIHSGKVICTSKLYFPYAGKIRVKDGYAWYVYRPFESRQTKFLYKEKLNSCKTD